jgi:hypothetical protein
VVKKKTKIGPDRITIRMPERNLRAIEKRAAHEGITPVEWCRNVLTASLWFDQNLYLLLCEVVATRRETRALVKELIQRGELSTERFNFLMSETEGKKEALAEKVLEQARKSLDRLPPPGDGK